MEQKVIILKGVPEIYNTPIAFNGLTYTEDQSATLLEKTIINAKEIYNATISALHENWGNVPAFGTKVVLSNWLTNSLKHFNAAIILTEHVFPSLVATVHHRQIFENFLQTKYFLSLSPYKQKTTSDSIRIIGCLELLEKLDPVKDQPEISKLIQDVKEILLNYESSFINEIKDKRKNNKKKQWFEMSYSDLARCLSTEGENLRGVYQILSADVHGHWNLLLDVQLSESGNLDFRGYSNKTQLFLGAADSLYQMSGFMLKSWDEIAEFVQATKIYYAKVESQHLKFHH